jgi:hypothetical protein
MNNLQNERTISRANGHHQIRPFGLGDAMPKRQSEQQSHSWAVYHIKGMPAKLVGIIADAPD